MLNCIIYHLYNTLLDTVKVFLGVWLYLKTQTLIYRSCTRYLRDTREKPPSYLRNDINHSRSHVYTDSCLIKVIFSQLPMDPEPSANAHWKLQNEYWSSCRYYLFNRWKQQWSHIDEV